MAGVSCDTCGKKLRIEIVGGTFYVREGSTLDDLNFEKAEDVKLITTLDKPPANEIDEDTTLTIEVMCSDDSSHAIFAHTISKIKCELYLRLMRASQQFIRKHS